MTPDLWCRGYVASPDRTGDDSRRSTARLSQWSRRQGLSVLQWLRMTEKVRGFHRLVSFMAGQAGIYRS
jgi:hypothetical protein